VTHPPFHPLAQQNQADFYARADQYRLVAEARCGDDQPTRWHRRRLARLFYALAERLDPQTGPFTMRPGTMRPGGMRPGGMQQGSMRPAEPMEACS
jgi:hypothetical protein